VDQAAQPDVVYDYLIVADYTGQLGFDAQKALSSLQQQGFKTVEGYIVFNKKEVETIETAGGSWRLARLRSARK
jgi:hypothetical protein